MNGTCGDLDVRPIALQLQKAASRFRHVELVLVVTALMMTAIVTGFGAYQTAQMRHVTETVERNQRAIEESQREVANNVRCQAEFFASRDATALQVEKQVPDPRQILSLCFQDPAPPTPPRQ